MLVQVFHLLALSEAWIGRCRTTVARSLSSCLAIVHFYQALIEIATFLEVINFIDESVHVLLSDLNDAWFLQRHFNASKAGCAWSCKAGPGTPRACDDRGRT